MLLRSGGRVTGAVSPSLPDVHADDVPFAGSQIQRLESRLGELQGEAKAFPKQFEARAKGYQADAKTWSSKLEARFNNVPASDTEAFFRDVKIIPVTFGLVF